MGTVNSRLAAPREVSIAFLWFKRIALGVVFAILIFLLFVLSVLAFQRIAGKNIPKVFGFAPLTVLTGSMEPVIYPGDMIVIQEADSYEEGDIITYVRMQGQTSTTHRIVDIYTEGGITYYVTKGDNNNTEDFPIVFSQIEGKVVLIIPGLGTFIEWLKTPAGITAILLFICVIAAFVYIVKT